MKTKHTSSVLDCFRELERLETEDYESWETEAHRKERIYLAEKALAKELHDSLTYTPRGY